MLNGSAAKSKSGFLLYLMKEKGELISRQGQQLPPAVRQTFRGEDQ